MSAVTINKTLFKNLAGKTIIITGGASGIGATTAKIIHSYGANVVIADIVEQSGRALATTFGKTGLFQRTDVTSWQSLLDLFHVTFETFGSIDHVCANAGVPEQGDYLLENRYDSEGRLAEPSFRLLDVNVNGVLRTIKLAINYFQKNKQGEGSITVTGSAASYFGAAPITVYSTGKHAVLGAVRSIANSTPINIRINLVAPWMTETEFNTEVRHIWGDMPINTQEDVALAIITSCVDKTLHGAGLWVANKQITDVEGALQKLQPHWLGEENSRLFDKGAHRLAEGMGMPTRLLGTSHIQ